MKLLLFLLVLILASSISTTAKKRRGKTEQKPNPPGDSDNGNEVGRGSDKDAEAKRALQDALGKEAKQETLNGGFGPIIKSSDLKCSFSLLETCNWNNGKNSSLKWGLIDSDTTIDDKKFKDEFDKANPGAPFAAVSSGPTGDSDQAVLTSGLIPCQRENGQLSFGYFLTDGVKLQVCRQDIAGVTISSCDELTGTDKGAVTSVQGGSPDKFRIAFVASNFKDGGVALLKDVRYSAKFCQATGGA